MIPPRPRTALGWEAAALGSLLVLLWVSRGAPLGTPVADDYDFLFWLRFHRPFELFDAMGGSPYWRPLSRQLYYGALGLPMLSAPWIAAALHVALFAALVTWIARAARRAFPAPVAAAIAVS